jgi:hypothetical protein
MRGAAEVQDVATYLVDDHLDGEWNKHEVRGRGCE